MRAERMRAALRCAGGARPGGQSPPFGVHRVSLAWVLVGLVPENSIRARSRRNWEPAESRQASHPLSTIKKSPGDIDTSWVQRETVDACLQSLIAKGSELDDDISDAQTIGG